MVIETSGHKGFVLYPSAVERWPETEDTQEAEFDISAAGLRILLSVDDLKKGRAC